MNVVMDHIDAQVMQHAPTQLAHTPVPASLATREMEEVAVIGMNAVLDHIDVQFMLHAQTQLAHTSAPAIRVTLEMEEIATGMNVMMDQVHVHLMLHVQTQWAHILAHAIVALLEMEENVHAQLDLLKIVESAMTSMNALMAHINVHLMPHVTTPLPHTSVSAIQDLLEMVGAVLAWLDLLKMGESAMTLMNVVNHINALLMPHVTTP